MRNLLKRHEVIVVPSAIIFLTLIFNIIWIVYTNYTEDDAYITFRFAQQLANGNGFVYNIGQPIYGTTTPLFTFLMAFWIRFISSDAALCGHLFGLLSLFGAQIFLWITLKNIGRPILDQAAALLAVTFSSKLLFMSSQGMEMPLTLFLMAISWYTFSKRKYFLCGLFCGLLVLTRMDLFLLPLVLFGFAFLNDKKQSLLLAAGGALIYGPWLVFATLYFGSPIPYTVTAKWVAYNQFDTTSFLSHAKTILEYLSPFDMLTKAKFIGPIFYFLPILLAIWKGKLLEKQEIKILAVFAVIEFVWLTFTRATFFTRYFVPLLWSLVILFGLSMALIWQHVKDGDISKWVFIIGLIIVGVGIGGTGRTYINYLHDRQYYRYERSHKLVGLWLRDHSDPSSTVLLEPLGYIGYFSQRIMIDTVGLVTPEVVELKRQRVDGIYYINEFLPDYTVLHCDEAVSMSSNENLVLNMKYVMLQEYNPLNFVPGQVASSDDPYDLARNSCYQIWGLK
jgi:hypothetical protein